MAYVLYHYNKDKKPYHLAFVKYIIQNVEIVY